MKKILAILGIVLILSLIAGAVYAAAPGTCTQNVKKWGDQAILTFLCTASPDDNSYPSTALSAANTADIMGYWIDEMVTYPGGTAPTDGTAVVLTMAPSGQDVFGARGVCSNTLKKSFVPIKDTPGSVYGGKTVTGAPTLAITGNSVASAIVNVVITLWKN